MHHNSMTNRCQAIGRFLLRGGSGRRSQAMRQIPCSGTKSSNPVPSSGESSANSVTGLRQGVRPALLWYGPAIRRQMAAPLSLLSASSSSAAFDAAFPAHAE
jgi:hypothetical protein